MSIENNTWASDVARRYASIENTYQYHLVDGAEIVSVDDLPVFIRLGKSALNTFVIVNPMTGLTDSETSNEGRSLNPDIQTLLIDPKTYSLEHNKGYKGLRDGDSITLGRSSQQDLDRFQPLPPSVSRRHGMITKSRDGKSIIIEDLNSTNGLYVGSPSPTEGESETISDESITTSDTAPNLEIFTAQSHASSVASERHPDRNEDSFINDQSHGLYGVFDGVGGQIGGDVASNAARRFISEHAGEAISLASPYDIDQYLQDTLVRANDHIVRVAPEAATTAVLTKIYTIEGITYASIAHSGDSRAYLLRDGILQTLTTDHTPFRRMFGTSNAVQQQERLATTDSLSILSDDDVHAFERRNVVGAVLGNELGVQTDGTHVVVNQGDRIILTSDGVHDNLTTQEMQTILSTYPGSDYASLLTTAARLRSNQHHMRSKPDDMTAVVVTI